MTPFSAYYPQLFLAAAVLSLSFGCSSGISASTTEAQAHTHGTEAPAEDHAHPAEDHDHPANTLHQEGHSHRTLEVDPSQPIPTIILSVTPDAMSGWNIHVQTEHFTFTPEQVNQANVPNQGHAHLYVDGEKVARLYGPWFHLADLPAGHHTISVGLNANGHDALTYQGKPIEATVTLEVP